MSRLKDWIALTALFLSLAACDGDSSSSSAPTAPTVPTYVEWYSEDGAVREKVMLDYQASGFTSRSLTPGEDGVWGTLDDSTVRYLDCHYAEAPDEVPMRGLLHFRAVGETSSGAGSLAIQGVPADGTHIRRCPARNGLNPAREDFGYVRLTYERSRSEQTIEEIQRLYWLPTDESSPEPPLLMVDQTALVTLNEDNLPTLVDISSSAPLYDQSIIDLCADDGPIHLLHISCHAMKQIQRFSRNDNRVTRDTDYYSALTFEETRRLLRVIDDNRRVMHAAYADVFPPSDATTPILSYQFNSDRRITRITERTAGVDEQWFTADDNITLKARYDYSAGRPNEFFHSGKQRRWRFTHDLFGRLQRINYYGGQPEKLLARQTYHYEHSQLASMIYYTRAEQKPEHPLVKDRQVWFEPVARGYPGFLVPGKVRQPWPPTLKSVMNQFYADVPWPAVH